MFPAEPNLPGIQNNFAVVQTTTYNLHKIDTKIDYQVTPKLRVSGRYGYQPYSNQQNPFFGQFLGGSSGGWPAFSANGAGNYLQNGATLAVSGSATYVFSPTLIIDGTFGVTQPHQLLFPTMTNVKVGLDTLGIPGTNIGALPWSGGMPNFDIQGYPSSTGTTFGYSYPPLEYKDPVFEYNANVTKIKGSHNIRFGEDIVRLHMNHKEVRNTVFQFTGGVTSTPRRSLAESLQWRGDYLLGLPQTTNVWFQPQQPYITLREYDFSVYARDQWQASHKLTINYGLRWEYFPVPTTATRGIQYNNLLSDINNPTMELCGVGWESRRLRYHGFEKAICSQPRYCLSRWTTIPSCAQAMLCLLPRWKWATPEPRLTRPQWKVSITGRIPICLPALRWRPAFPPFPTRCRIATGMLPFPSERATSTPWRRISFAATSNPGT